MLVDNGKLMRFWSRRQKAVSLSSWESELYGVNWSRSSRTSKWAHRLESHGVGFVRRNSAYDKCLEHSCWFLEDTSSAIVVAHLGVAFVTQLECLGNLRSSKIGSRSALVWRKSLLVPVSLHVQRVAG